jgi:predicted transcriptional regulator
MVALPLFDVVLSSGQSQAQWPIVAAQLVQSALADLGQLEELDDSLSSENPFRFDRPTATLIRGMYERWAQDTESLLERIARVERRSGRVSGAEFLRDAHGKTRARLSISLEQIERGLKDVAEGRTIPVDEVRRELRLRTQ